METKKDKKQENKTPTSSKDQIAVLEQKIEELENNWKRALADYQNFSKRAQEERFEIIKYSNQTLVLKMISVLDNLELVEKHVVDKGLEMALKEFQKVLADEGAETMDILDKDFDATTMEAVELIEKKGKQGKVIEVLKKGYKFKDKVIRPAKVKVGA